MKTKKARKMRSTQCTNDLSNCENKGIKPVENNNSGDTEL